MDDIYVAMLFETAEKYGIPLVKLCEGICTAEMLYMMKKGKKAMDRTSIKRILARLGIDSIGYAKFLEYTEYEIWLKRMNIINAIEDDRLLSATKEIEDYKEIYKKNASKSRGKFEQQFILFMEIQLIEHRKDDKAIKKLCSMYEKAVKLTVPAIDEKRIQDICMSPVEFVMALEYKCMGNESNTIDEIISKYAQWFDYLENAPFGKVAIMKVYPRVVLSMYKEVQQLIHILQDKDKEIIYKQLFTHSKKAIELLAERKFLYYEIEMLEISVEMLKNILLNLKDEGEIKVKQELLCKREKQLEALINLYERYNVNPYMLDACYLYRESGVYCISEVLKTRREMLGLTQDELCAGICDKRTVVRSEKKNGTLQRVVYKELFNKLKIYPEYISMGIVTENKKDMELFEELRFASNSRKYDIAKDIIEKLKKSLPKHPINLQMLCRQESFNKWQREEITGEEHIENLKKALSYTIDIQYIYGTDRKIFLTTSELSTFYQMSTIYSQKDDFQTAYEYIEVIWKYCKKAEEQGVAEGIMGIYEMVMTYVANLLGDMRRHEESKKLSESIIKLSLRIRRNGAIHHNLYNIAWNENECGNAMKYCDELHHAIMMCQLCNDSNYILFYTKGTTEY